MVSTRGVILLLAVSAAAIASTEAKTKTTEATIKSHLKDPVLKASIVHNLNMQVAEKTEGNKHFDEYLHGKGQYVVDEPEADSALKQSKMVAEKPTEKPKPTATQEPTEDADAEEFVVKIGINMPGKTFTAEKFANGTTVLIYPNGTRDWFDGNEFSFDVKVGDQKYTFDNFENDSTVLTYPKGTHQWLDEKEIYLDFEESKAESEATRAGKQNGSLSGSRHQESDPEVGQEEGIVGEIEKDAKSVAKKFSELATTLTGNDSHEAAPIIVIGGAIGALAAVVGIAAVAIGRARRNTADANSESVLAEVTEDVEADVEAGETEEKKEDESAEI